MTKYEKLQFAIDKTVQLVNEGKVILKNGKDADDARESLGILRDEMSKLTLEEAAQEEF